MSRRPIDRATRLAVYTLKRKFGGTIYLYKQGNPSTDLKTGQKVWPNRQVTTVDKAIILPVKMTRDQEVKLQETAFKYGGYIDHGSRWFYIDPRDLPSGYEVEQDDHIVYRGKQYEIKVILDTEFDSLYQIQATELTGVVPQQIFELTGKSLMGIGQKSEEVNNGV